MFLWLLGHTKCVTLSVKNLGYNDRDNTRIPSEHGFLIGVPSVQIISTVACCNASETLPAEDERQISADIVDIL